MRSGLDDPQFWKWRADAARMLADEINDDQGKASMLRIAEEYQSLAARCISNSSIPCSEVASDSAEIVELPSDKGKHRSLAKAS